MVLLFTPALTPAIGNAAETATATATATPTADDSAENDNKNYHLAMQALADGNETEARRLLHLVIREVPNHAGAWFDLALLFCGMGMADDAERLFSEMERRFSPPPPIQTLIDQIRRQGCKTWKPRTQLWLRSGVGYDSNVNQAPGNPVFSVINGGQRIDLVLHPALRQHGSTFFSVQGGIIQELPRPGDLFFFNFSNRRHRHYSPFNTASWQVGLEHPWSLSDGQIALTGSVNQIFLGTRSYLRQYRAELNYQPTTNIIRGWHKKIAAALTHAHYSALNAYDGQTWELRGELQHITSQNIFFSSAGIMYDRAWRNRPGGNKVGAFLGLGAHHRFNANWSATLAWQGQSWHGKDVYSPGFIDQRRHQNTHIVRAQIAHQINSQTTLGVEANWVKNHENISLFRYSGFSAMFFYHWQLQLR